MSRLPAPPATPSRERSLSRRPPWLGEAAARAIVDEACARYFAARRARVALFVDTHFSLAGSLRLHRHALGWDLLRAPFNLAMVAPSAGLKLGAAGARRLGAGALSRRLEAQNLFLRTAVGREIEWLFYSELLELPFAQGPRACSRDALAEEIFRDERVIAAFQPVLLEIARRGQDAALRERLAEALAAYVGTRAAASDVAMALLSSSVGALAFKQLTPSALTLGPAMAAAIAQKAAVAGFPLGAGLGGLWYGLFPAAAAPALLIGTTGGLMTLAAALAAFAGIVADPVQRRLGLHQRRLRRLLAVLERQFRGEGTARFVVRDHYVGRLLDLVDIVRTAQRLLP